MPDDLPVGKESLAPPPSNLSFHLKLIPYQGNERCCTFFVNQRSVCEALVSDEKNAATALLRAARRRAGSVKVKAACSVKKGTHWPVFRVPITANRGWRRSDVVSLVVIVAPCLLYEIAEDIPARSRNQIFAELPDTQDVFRYHLNFSGKEKPLIWLKRFCSEREGSHCEKEGTI
jgi:hypothetical protein